MTFLASRRLSSSPKAMIRLARRYSSITSGATIKASSRRTVTTSRRFLPAIGSVYNNDSRINETGSFHHYHFYALAFQSYSSLTTTAGGAAQKRPTENAAVKTFSTAAVEEDTQSSSSSTIPFLLADIGEGIAEVELLQWFVEEGDAVQQFDRICEVQSDKATVEITSRYDGIVTKMDHSIGDMIKVGSPLLFLQGDGDDISLGMNEQNENHHNGFLSDDEEEQMLRIPSIASQYHLETDIGGPAAARSEDGVRHRVQTTPAIRKLSKEYNLDLSTIVGTGPQGRVLKGDVLTVLRERGLMASTPPASLKTWQAPMASTSSLVAATPPPTTTPAIIKDVNEVAGRPLTQDTTLEIRGYNRLMVQSMTQSLQIPHMVFADEVIVGNLLQHKQDLPFLPFAVKAMSQALVDYPILNSTYDSDNSQVKLWQNHNIGIAMDTPRGLIVPVIKKCQDKSIKDILEDLKRLKALAQDTASGGVPAEDLQGATITLSNIGAVGTGTYMSPIVTAPQVAIGAIGAIQRLPRFVDSDSKDIDEVHVCNISWGGDHRVIDGATMARFHKQWKEYMEHPMKLIQGLK